VNAVTAKRCRVLVVDDEPMIAKAIRRAFPEADVVAAHSGVQALALLQTDEEFQLILCDLMMPDMSGMNVYDTLQQQRLAAAQRMVFMTGGSRMAALNDFLGTVPNRWLKKPFAIDEIRQFLPQLQPPAVAPREVS
jgi:CheY-like chemotaxis protein